MENFRPITGDDFYASLPLYSDIRTKEISEMVQPFIDITDQYGRLISRLTLILGNNKPNDVQDIVVRDLLADVFDFLYECRILIIGSKLNIAFPLARRAYESLLLMVLCVTDKTKAEKWQEGKKFGNAEVRKALGKHPAGENEEELRDLYAFFSLASHPNRELIPRRFLGEGNQYVLGAIGQPDLTLICDYFIKLLEMWFWFVAVVSTFYRMTIILADNQYFETYMQTARQAQVVKNALVDNLNRLLKADSAIG